MSDSDIHGAIQRGRKVIVCSERCWVSVAMLPVVTAGWARFRIREGTQYEVEGVSECVCPHYISRKSWISLYRGPLNIDIDKAWYEPGKYCGGTGFY